MFNSTACTKQYKSQQTIFAPGSLRWCHVTYRVGLKCLRDESITHYIYIYIYIYIYSLIYTPLPDSRWLHHRALRYVRRVQLGAYMWRKGLNSVPTDSKWAQNTCLCSPNSPGSQLLKHVFDPILTHFSSQNGPFSRHIGVFLGPKPVPIGSKWSKNTSMSVANGPGLLLGKCVFDQFLTHY